MAGSATVGTLRAVLTAETATFSTAMKKAAEEARLLTRDLKNIGQQASNIGAQLTKTITLPLAAIGASATKLAIDFESSFAGVRKTVNATEAEFAQMAQGFRNLAKEIPINVNELNRIGEAAGQLGIKKENILDFSRVMAQLGVTTNLTADQAASSLARLANITGMPQTEFERLGSTIVALGNNSAATESEIVDFGLRIAAAGKIANLTEAQILGIGTAMSSVGMEAEAGGTAVQKVLNDMTAAVATGNDSLALFAKTAGLSAQQFAAAFKKDAAGAFTAFVEGLGREGDKAFKTLDDLKLGNERVIRAFLSLANAGTLLSDTLRVGTTAWRENNALSEEARKRFETTEAQLTLLWNRIKDVGITIGNALLPAIRSAVALVGQLLPFVDGMAKGFAAIPGPIQFVVVGLAGIVAAAFPLIFMFGQLAIAASAATGAFTRKGLVMQGLAAQQAVLTGTTTGLTTATTALAAVTTGLSRAFAFLLGPWGLALTAAGALGLAVYKLATSESELMRSVKENVDAFRSHTSELERALSTYDQLRQKQSLTDDETRQLEESTRLLANASGLSTAAFEKEARGSAALTDSLREQLKARKELLEEGVQQARDQMNAVFEAIESQRNELAKVMSGRGEIVERGDRGEDFRRDMTKSERFQAIERINKSIVELQQKFEAARQAYLRMSGSIGADVNLPGVVNTLANAAGAADTYAERLRLTRQAVANLTAEQRREIDAARALGDSIDDVHKKTGIAKEVLHLYQSTTREAARETKKYQEALQDVLSATEPVSASTAHWILSLKNLGVAESDIARVLKVTEAQIKQVVDAQKLRERVEAEIDKVLKAVHDDQMKRAQALAQQTLKTVQIQVEAQKRLRMSQLEGVDLRLAEIAETEKAELAALAREGDARTKAYDEAERAIKEFYDRQRDLANSTFSTITERMRAQGIFTRSDLRATADAYRRDYEQMRRAGVFTAQQIQEAWERWYKAEKQARETFGDEFQRTMQTVLDSVSQGFQHFAQHGDGMFAEISRAVLDVTQALRTATQAGAQFQAGIAQLKDGGALEGMAGIAGAAIQAAAAMEQATRSASKTANVLGGAAAGAQFGANFGPYGALVGAGVGALVGALRDNKPSANDVRDEWMAAAGGLEAVQKRIAALANDPELMRAFSRLYASTSPEQFIRHAREFETRFNDLMTNFGRVTERAGLIWSQTTHHMIANAEDLGLEITQVIEIMNRQIQSAVGGLGRFLQAGAGAQTEIKRIQKEIAELQKANADPETDDDEVEANNELLKKLNEELQTQQRLWKAVGIASQESAEAIGASLFGLFGKMREQGTPIIEALKQLQPAVQAFQEQLAEAGFTGGAGFEALQAMISVLTDSVAGPAIEAVDALGSSLIGLQNLGLLNQETFAGLAGQIGHTFAELVAQGHDGEQIMRLMQEPLQRLWELQQDFGYAVDEATQALIDQAVQAGIVGEQARDPMDRMVRAMEHVADTLDRIAGAFGVLPEAAGRARQGIEDEFSGMDVRVPVTFEYGEGPGMEGAETQPIPRFANRPWEQVTREGWAYVDPGDVVGVPPAGGSGSGVQITNVMRINDRELGRAVALVLPEALRSLGFRVRN